MPSWKAAPALLQLLSQVNAKWPNRSKESDGLIGDASHQSRKSDHDPNSFGIVCALDITNDPLHGLVSEELAEALRKAKDPRLHYIISNRKIANVDIDGGNWRLYSGINAHNHHCHISVRQYAEFWDDRSPWKLDEVAAPVPGIPFIPPPATLRIGSSGEAVMELQKLLALAIDGSFGERTKTAVKEFQKAHGLLSDGVVGPATWALLKGTKL